MTQNRPALEFKGRMMTLTILRVLDPSVEVIARELDRRVQEAPQFFRHLPVLIDVGAVADSELHEDLPGLAALLRTHALVPVGVRGGDGRWSDAAEAAGLATYPAERLSKGDANGHAPEEDAAPEPSGQRAPENAAGDAPAAGGSLVVTQPVRSGQQVYARGGDLVVLATVSPGAEVLADGHVHVYGTLNGRALAGVRGDPQARIFCQSLRADLLSIAGIYSVSDQFDPSLHGRPVQVSLHDNRLRVEPL